MLDVHDVEERHRLENAVCDGHFLRKKYAEVAEENREEKDHSARGVPSVSVFNRREFNSFGSTSRIMRLTFCVEK